VSNKELIQHKSLNLELIKTKEFLKVKEVAALLDCSIRSVYYYIDQGVIEAMNIGHRMTRVKRASLEKLIGLKVKSQEDEVSLKKEYTIEDCISTYEIRRKFGISESALRDLIIRNNIPKLRNGSFAFVPKVEIEKYLGIRIEI